MMLFGEYLFLTKFREPHTPLCGSLLFLSLFRNNFFSRRDRKERRETKGKFFWGVFDVTKGVAASHP